MKIVEGNKFIEFKWLLEDNGYSYKDVLVNLVYKKNKLTKIKKIVVSKQGLNDFCFDIRMMLFGTLDKISGENDDFAINIESTLVDYKVTIKLKKLNFEISEIINWNQLNNIYHEIIDYCKERITCCVEDYIENDNQVIFKNDKYEVISKMWFGTKNVYYDKKCDKFITYLTKNDNQKAYLVFDKEGKLLNDYHIDYLCDFNDGVAVYGVNGDGVGFVDENFNIITEAKYEYCTDFKNGLSLVRTVGKEKFLVDTTGKIIEGTNFLCTNIYKNIEGFSEGMCRVSLMEEDVNLQYFHEAYGVAGMWGYMNTEGKIVIPPQYIFANDFENGLAMVAKGNWVKNAEGKLWMDKELWGVIDKQGNEVVPCIYEEIEVLDFENFQYFLVRQNGLFGVVDNKGKMLVKPKFFGFGYECKGDLLVYYDEYEFNEYTGQYYDAKLGVYDFINNRVVFEPQFLDVELLDDNLMIVEYYDSVKGKVLSKVIDVDGKEYLKGFEYICNSKNNYFVYQNDRESRKYGIVDLEGNIILEPTYDITFSPYWECENERYIFEENEKYGIKSFSGEVLLSAIYDEIKTADDVIFVKKDGKWGMQSLEGDVLVECIYENYEFKYKRDYYLFFDDLHTYVYYLKRNDNSTMTLLEKVEYVRAFVNKNHGNPLMWLEVTPKVEILNKAVELINNNPDLSLQDFMEIMGIDV